jgi:deoxyribodipyrimidine photo-lyase
LESVDGNGLLPLSDADHAFPTAYAFRRHLQRRLPVHVEQLPEPDPLAGHTLRPVSIPPEIAARWPSATGGLASLPVDHDVAPVDGRRGGELAGTAMVSEFVGEKLARYVDERNDPDRETTSGLSPYLHFGHVSAHHVFLAVAAKESWSPRDLASTPAGRREGWWGMSASAEAFLDQLVTWRELGYNGCAHGNDYETLACLPAWATRTLAEHASDPRAIAYGMSELSEARTHDPLWNAAQVQLLREGRIHNYLRMLWGKKILEWTRSPQEALAIMVALNDRFALDGRDPNSYSGITWVLGRYDRAWGPERPIFGTVRYMSSENTARKMRLAGYLRRFGRVD